MPLRFEFAAGPRVLHVTFEGVLDDASLRKAYHEVKRYTRATDPAIGMTADHVARLLEWAQRLAETAYTGGSREATLDQLAPPSPEPNTSPDVPPKYSSSESPAPVRPNAWRSTVR